MSLKNEIVHCLKGSCFTWTLSDALNILESDVLKVAKSIPETRWRAYYSCELIDELLSAMNVEHTIIRTSSYQDFKESIRVGDILAYNAEHGRILIDKAPKMLSGHYARILSVNGDMFTGIQSNTDGERNNVLHDKSLHDLYTSSMSLVNLRVDYGKLEKCKIKIPKHSVVILPRCGENVCTFTGNNRCVFMSNVGGIIVRCKYE